MGPTSIFEDPIFQSGDGDDAAAGVDDDDDDDDDTIIHINFSSAHSHHLWRATVHGFGLRVIEAKDRVVSLRLNSSHALPNGNAIGYQ